jgi:hypothetical protein
MLTSREGLWALKPIERVASGLLEFETLGLELSPEGFEQAQRSVKRFYVGGGKRFHVSS